VQNPQLGYWLSHFVFLDRHFSQALAPRSLGTTFPGDEELLSSQSSAVCVVRLRFAGLISDNKLDCITASGISMFSGTLMVKSCLVERLLGVRRGPSDGSDDGCTYACQKTLEVGSADIWADAGLEIGTSRVVRSALNS
jgi:hypothetical protein